MNQAVPIASIKIRVFAWQRFRMRYSGSMSHACLGTF